jgi:superfamily II DNA or RNA helicase
MASTRIVQLRPYQQQAISDLRMAYRGGLSSTPAGGAHRHG